MKITNRLNLPEPIVKALENKGYDKGLSDITATGLIEPPRIGALKEKYADVLTEDASELIYSLQGQSVHTILERAAKDLEAQGYISEKRFYHEIAGWKVGAQIDIYNSALGLLQDYKVTSVYSVKSGVKEEYAIQMNIQAYIMRQNGHDVKKMQIVAILRDWSKGQYERDTFGDYPEHQVKVLNVPLIPEEEVLKYLEARVREHQAARGANTDEELPLCSPEDRWARPDKWAVMEKGKKRALSLQDSLESARIMVSKADNLRIEHRPGVNTRCEQYCPVRDKCSQYAAMKAKENKN